MLVMGQGEEREVLILHTEKSQKTGPKTEKSKSSNSGIFLKIWR